MHPKNCVYLLFINFQYGPSWLRSRYCKDHCSVTFTIRRDTEQSFKREIDYSFSKQNKNSYILNSLFDHTCRI